MMRKNLGGLRTQKEPDRVREYLVLFFDQKILIKNYKKVVILRAK